ncbi:MAG: hypothetical protein H3C57_01930 [Gammaproteobacteria bacterium]|nr:hypothetical protein [Gammaproteobacteria bacterium]
MKKHLIPILLLSGVALAGTAVAADQGKYRQGNGKRGAEHTARAASVERLAMQNLLAENLAQSTGRDVNEIKALFAQGHPGKVAADLGLDRAAMGKAMEAARSTYIQRSLAAGLITSEQAQELATTPPRGQRSPR